MKRWTNAETFMRNVTPEPNTGCWFWTAHADHNGYGRVSWGGHRGVKATRASWEIATGSPPSAQVLHKCDQPLCVNPAHLFLGTAADNHADKARKGRARGSANGYAYLTDEIVRTILVRRRAGATLGALATEFGLTKQHVHAITARKLWRHVCV